MQMREGIAPPGWLASEQNLVDPEDGSLWDAYLLSATEGDLRQLKVVAQQPVSGTANYGLCYSTRMGGFTASSSAVALHGARPGLMRAADAVVREWMAAGFSKPHYFTPEGVRAGEVDSKSPSPSAQAAE